MTPLADASAHYVDLFALAPAAYCTLSAHGLIVQANQAATALLKVTQDALIEQSLTRFIVDADLDKFDQYRQRVIRLGQAQSCALRMVDAERRPFRAHLQSVRAHDADGAVQLRTVLSDISDISDICDIGNIAPGYQSADGADLAESQMRAKIGHDMRQPLSALSIYATVLKSHVAPAGQPLLTQIQLCLASVSELLAK